MTSQPFVTRPRCGIPLQLPWTLWHDLIHRAGGFGV